MTKHIPLTQGKFALVDDRDYEELSKHKWYYEHGYARRDYQIAGKRHRVYMHKLIAGTPDGMHTDHINGDKLDNRAENLRVCSASENQMNSEKNKNSSSKYKGVSFYKRDEKWQAGIMLNRKDIYLGRFTSEIEAAKAYNEAAINYFGEFAKLNILKEVA